MIDSFNLQYTGTCWCASPYSNKGTKENFYTLPYPITCTEDVTLHLQYNLRCLSVQSRARKIISRPRSCAV